MTSGTDTIHDLFRSTVSLVRSSSSDNYITDEEKLKLYGFYKRCIDGKLSESGTPEPARWNVAAYRKCNAWKKCDNLELDEAMERYIELVAGFNDTTGGYECKRLLNAFLSQSTNDGNSDS
jgi:acyl-CoA-binding protein